MPELGGFFLVTAAGLCWIGLGISVSMCAARGWNFNIVQGLNYLGSVMLCALLLAGSGPRGSFNMLFGWGFLLSCLAGIANFFAYVLVARAMRKGPNGLVWGIMQAGMIGSFLMGVIFFGEPAAPLRLAGLGLILSGVLMMGMSRDGGVSWQGRQWMLPSLGAFLLVMVTHCCSALPSYLAGVSPAGGIVRTMGLYSGGAIGFALVTLPEMIRRRNWGGRGEWISAGILMLLNTSASVFFFYRGLDLLAKRGCGGLGYPLAIGVCITGFSLYSLLILKEKIARPGLIGLGAVCIGIIIIAIR